MEYLDAGFEAALGLSGEDASVAGKYHGSGERAGRHEALVHAAELERLGRLSGRGEQGNSELIAVRNLGAGPGWASANTSSTAASRAFAKSRATAVFGILQAPVPARPIDHGLARPGLLAHVLTAKYSDHLPLYRQAEIYARERLAKALAKIRLGEAIHYALPRWPALLRYCEMAISQSMTTPQNVLYERSHWDQRIICSAGSDTGGERAAAVYILIGSAKLERPWIRRLI